MKHLFALFLLMILPVVAQAQTPVSKETANTYFTNCVKQPPMEQFTQEGQNMFCACTAARMTQFYTMEDMAAATGTDPVTARPAYNKMIALIYAPCMEIPVREHYYNTCMNNPDSARYRDRKGTCFCLGNTMGTHFKLRGEELFTQILTYNPNITDPMAAALTDPSVQTLAQEKLLSCLK